MALSMDKKANQQFNLLVGVVSVAIPAVVALLLFMPKAIDLGIDVSMLPHLNAILNSATSVCLILAFFAIKNQNIPLHRTLMMTAFTLSSIFLVSYVLYHSQSLPTRYGDADGNGIVSAAELLAVGNLRLVYFFFLATHIILAIVVVPFVLFAFYFALTGQIERHKKIVKWTFPIWTYVAITGVVVYAMISKYYV
jgi:putative membrane protein